MRAATHQGGSSLPAGTSPCQLPICKTCPYIDSNTTFYGPSGKFHAKSNLTCTSSDLIYILTCTLCQKMYVGETYRSLSERFSEHLRSIRLKYSNPVGSHFNDPLHNLSHVRMAAVWKNGQSGIYRKFMESAIKPRPGTLQPNGLNCMQ